MRVTDSSDYTAGFFRGSMSENEKKNKLENLNRNGVIFGLYQEKLI